MAFSHKEPGANIRILGEPAMAINAQRETGANVIDTMAAIEEAIEELKAGALPDAGLTIRQVYDETVYIDSAINLVNQNIMVGGALAALMLLLFLRSGYATLIVSIAIPVSVVASFVAMAFMGRSLNVISLAGIAFAVGMVVDAAIVVLENIYRLRQTGMPPAEAAYQGAKQVWGAILVSALTTVMVFIPILTMELEVGQLFRDIAVAISVAVMLSLLVAMTVIPALSKRLLTKVRPIRRGHQASGHRPPRRRLFQRGHGVHPRRGAQSRARPWGRRRRHLRGARQRLCAPPQARISPRRQPQSGVRRDHPAARLQPRHQDRDRQDRRGGLEAAVVRGNRRRARTRRSAKNQKLLLRLGGAASSSSAPSPSSRNAPAS